MSRVLLKGMLQLVWGLVLLTGCSAPMSKDMEGEWIASNNDLQELEDSPVIDKSIKEQIGKLDGDIRFILYDRFEYRRSLKSWEKLEEEGL